MNVTFLWVILNLLDSIVKQGVSQEYVMYKTPFSIFLIFYGPQFLLHLKSSKMILWSYRVEFEKSDNPQLGLIGFDQISERKNICGWFLKNRHTVSRGLRESSVEI